MSKKLLVGLIVAFVVAAVLPLAAQAQQVIPQVRNCKYVGPADPLALNTVSWGDGEGAAYTKTVKAQKEIFYCYNSYRDIPDDKTLQDPLANRDKINRGLMWIVELEIFAFIAERLEPDGDVDIRKWFEVTRCVKERRTGQHEWPGPGYTSTILETWVVAGCQSWEMEEVPGIPEYAARGCAPEYNAAIVGRTTRVTTRQPFVHGAIPVEDPMEMNTVPIDFENDGVVDFIKTIKVNKEVFRCAYSADPAYPADRFGGPFSSFSSGPVIYDIELYTEELELAGTPDFWTDDTPPYPVLYPFPTEWKGFEVAYCAKYEPWAIIMGCSWRTPGINPFTEGAGVPAALKPFTTLTSAGVRPSAGKYVFEAQGYNIEGVQVQVYNLAGKQVFSAETGGTQLSWNGLSSDGRRLANGVYLYVMTVKGTYGDIVQTKVQKLAILR